MERRWGRKYEVWKEGEGSTHRCHPYAAFDLQCLSTTMARGYVQLTVLPTSSRKMGVVSAPRNEHPHHTIIAEKHDTPSDSPCPVPHPS